MHCQVPTQSFRNTYQGSYWNTAAKLPCWPQGSTGGHYPSKDIMDPTAKPPITILKVWRCTVYVHIKIHICCMIEERDTSPFTALRQFRFTRPGSKIVCITAVLLAVYCLRSFSVTVKDAAQVDSETLLYWPSKYPKVKYIYLVFKIRETETWPGFESGRWV